MLGLIPINFNAINKFNGVIALIFETYFGSCATIQNYIKMVFTEAAQENRY